MNDQPAQVQISFDEISNMFQQLYPEQFQRVVAEIKALKYEQMYLQAIQQDEESTDGDS